MPTGEEGAELGGLSRFGANPLGGPEVGVVRIGDGDESPEINE